MLESPVAFFIFNRPHTTERVFAKIAKAKPRTLLVVADGARAHIPGEQEMCAQTRQIIERVDWDCTVLTNYADHNMGCRTRVSSGLDWVFTQVEEAIILEDDCLPDSSFFPFCEALLAKYRHNDEVMHINGSFLGDDPLTQDSYYFSKFSHPWGWATWRRAWRHYDIELKMWRDARDKRVFLKAFSDNNERRFWKDKWNKALRKINDWDYQWMFAITQQRGLVITPACNLVRNIGWGAGATHTFNPSNRLATLPVFAIDFPLRHPSHREVHQEADAEIARRYSRAPSRPRVLINKVKRRIYRLRYRVAAILSDQ